jgi:hypothetical protein
MRDSVYRTLLSVKLKLVKYWHALIEMAEWEKARNGIEAERA